MKSKTGASFKLGLAPATLHSPILLNSCWGAGFSEPDAWGQGSGARVMFALSLHRRPFKKYRLSVPMCSTRRSQRHRLRPPAPCSRQRGDFTAGPPCLHVIGVQQMLQEEERGARGTAPARPTCEHRCVPGQASAHTLHTHGCACQP